MGRSAGTAVRAALLHLVEQHGPERIKSASLEVFEFPSNWINGTGEVQRLTEFLATHSGEYSR